MTFWKLKSIKFLLRHFQLPEHHVWELSIFFYENKLKLNNDDMDDWFYGRNFRRGVEVGSCSLHQSNIRYRCRRHHGLERGVTVTTSPLEFAPDSIALKP